MLKLRTLCRETSSNSKQTDGEQAVDDNNYGIQNFGSEAWRKASKRSASGRTDEMESPVTTNSDSRTDGAEPEEDVDMFQPGDTDVDGSDDVVSVINFDDSFVRFVMTTDEADDRPEVLCVICYEMDRFDCRPCCRGSVCDECLRHHIKTQLTDFGNVRITCPCAGCDHLVYQAEVHHMLSSADGHELLAKYERWIAAANSQGPNRKTCPRCSDITEVDSSVLNVSRLAKCGIPVRCVGCQLDWCFLCHAPMHTGITCKAFRAGDKLLKQWAIDVRDAGDRNAQRCPKCKVYIERNGGCDHMQCSRCNTKFCYRCGHRRRTLKLFHIKLEDHDQKLSILGCKALYKKNNPAHRVLVRGAIVGGKVVGGTAAVAVGLPLVVGLAGVVVGAAVIALPAFGIYRLVSHVRTRRTRSDQ